MTNLLSDQDEFEILRGILVRLASYRPTAEEIEKQRQWTEAYHAREAEKARVIREAAEEQKKLKTMKSSVSDLEITFNEERGRFEASNPSPAERTKLAQSGWTWDRKNLVFFTRDEAVVEVK